MQKQKTNEERKWITVALNKCVLLFGGAKINGIFVAKGGKREDYKMISQAFS